MRSDVFFSGALMITVISGTPTICVTVWAVLRLHFHDTGYNTSSNMTFTPEKEEMHVSHFHSVKGT